MLAIANHFFMIRYQYYLFFITVCLLRLVGDGFLFGVKICKSTNKCRNVTVFYPFLHNRLQLLVNSLFSFQFAYLCFGFVGQAGCLFLCLFYHFCFSSLGSNLGQGVEAFSTSFSPSRSAVSTKRRPASSAFFLMLATCSSVVPFPAMASTTLLVTTCFTSDSVSMSMVGLVKVPPMRASTMPT